MPVIARRCSPIARIFTALGEPTVLIGAGFLCCALAVAGRGTRRLRARLLLVILIGRGLSEVQKYWIARARPDLEPHLVVVKTSSLPERPCDQLDDLLPDAGAGAGRRHAAGVAPPPLARSFSRC